MKFQKISIDMETSVNQITTKISFKMEKTKQEMKIGIQEMLITRAQLVSQEIDLKVLKIAQKNSAIMIVNHIMLILQ